MGKSFEKRKPLSPELPVETITRWKKDEDGDEVTEVDGFNGNVSASPIYVTDGHALLVAEFIPEEMKADIKPHENYDISKVTEAKQKTLLDEVRTRKKRKAEFIGCATVPWEASEPEGDFYTVAVTRTVDDDLFVLFNAHLLAFVLKYTRPDEMLVALTDTCNQAAEFHRDGKIVAVLMPMRISYLDLCKWDLIGPAVDVFKALAKI